MNGRRAVAFAARSKVEFFVAASGSNIFARRGDRFQRGIDWLRASALALPNRPAKSLALLKLVIACVVDSGRGTYGGFRLAKPLKWLSLSDISLSDIVEAIDEPPRFNVETLDGVSASDQ